MTYVSRKTRIIVSSWTDVCSAEYIFHAFRKRSDGRLKNYNSCHDLRAWMNNSCVQNEYFLDLMSEGEFLGEPPFALYGRFIPVPILFKILESGKANEKDVKAETEKENSQPENLNTVEWEKNQAQKNLLECTCLLNTAIRKLEKLENIIEIANSETQTARANEIKQAFCKAKAACRCDEYRSSSLSSLNSASDNCCKWPRRKSKDTDTYNDLMRKVSQLKKKLKEVQITRCEILHEIRKAEKIEPCSQVQELYNREDQNLIKKLERELEKLVAEKGKLLSEMYNILNSLNALRMSMKSSFGGRKGSLSSDRRDSAKGQERTRCKCGCNGFDTTDSDNIGVSECDNSFKRTNVYTSDSTELPEKLTSDFENEKPEKPCGDTSPRSDATFTKISNHSGKTLSNPRNSTQTSNSNSQIKKSKKSKSAEFEKKAKIKKSKVKFHCKIPSCRNKLYSDDLSVFENSLTPEQKAVILKAVKMIEKRRPSTTPITKREKRETELKSELYNQTTQDTKKVPLREVKSETVLKEFEKTIRHYERRLKNLESLENKLENLAQKSAKVCNLKKKLAKVKEEAKKQKAADKEKFNTEISRLCTENWELKKNIQELMAKFEAQNKKIQTLRCSATKARGLECEAEELKKELSEYREGFEHQRKCISKLESVAAMQRTEIENLMNHIRKLTAVREDSQCHSFQDRRYAQRSRSFSPDFEKERPRPRRKSSKEFKLTSEEDENCCYCGQHSQVDGRQKIQPKISIRSRFSPANGNVYRYK